MLECDWFLNSPYLWFNWLFSVQSALQTFEIERAKLDS